MILDPFFFGSLGGYSSYDPSTGVIAGKINLGFQSGGGIAVDSSGVIYGLSSLGGYSSYDPSTGVTAGKINLGFQSDGGIAVLNTATVPVPPSVWLFISGLIGLIRIGRKNT